MSRKTEIKIAWIAVIGAILVAVITGVFALVSNHTSQPDPLKKGIQVILDGVENQSLILIVVNGDKQKQSEQDALIRKIIQEELADKELVIKQLPKNIGITVLQNQSSELANVLIDLARVGSYLLIFDADQKSLSLMDSNTGQRLKVISLDRL